MLNAKLIQLLPHRNKRRRILLIYHALPAQRDAKAAIHIWANTVHTHLR